MIRYKCASCGEPLETNDSMGMQQEPCPVCGQPNTVPKSRQQRKQERKQRKQERKQRKEQAEREREKKAIEKLRKEKERAKVKQHESNPRQPRREPAAAPPKPSLRPCPACQGQVSSAATACPRCGHPFGTSPSPPRAVQTGHHGHGRHRRPRPSPPRAVQTVEATGKKWKALMLLGGGVSIVGTVMLVSGSSADGPSAAAGFGLLMLLAGIVIAVVARIGAWWFHG